MPKQRIYVNRRPKNSMFENKLSIMVKPTGKSAKGEVSVRKDGNYVKACFPRNYCKGTQIKLATGISLNDPDWQETAEKLKVRLQIALEDGKLDDGQGNFNEDYYDEILMNLGLRSRLKLVKATTAPTYQKPELSITEIWDLYCHSRKDLAETSYKLVYRRSYLNYINSAIAAVGEDPEKIKRWLLQNRSLYVVKGLLQALKKAYEYVINNKLYSLPNPFFDSGEHKGKIGKQGYTEREDYGEVTDIDKAYTWEEAQTIMEFIKNKPNMTHWYNFISFKFMTGVRTGEAIALWWRDVRWDEELILIRRTYNRTIKKNFDTKNERVRLFPMPANGDLWNLLKSIPEGLPNENVFKSREGKVINDTLFRRTWNGNARDRYGKPKAIIPALFEEGKISKRLPGYNTRHTFITHQIHCVGVPQNVVSAWCEHSESVSRKHYQDIQSHTVKVIPGYGKADNSQIEGLQKQIQEMQQMLDRLVASK